MTDQVSDMNDKLEETTGNVESPNLDSAVTPPVETPDATQNEAAQSETAQSETAVPETVASEEIASKETASETVASEETESEAAAASQPEDQGAEDKGSAAAEPVAAAPETAEPIAKKDWYILKVQVNREDSIKRRLEERVKQTGLEKYIEEILVPTEKVTTVKNGKKRVVKRKLYPGYLMVNMEINEETWFLVRETAGIGDFTGAAGKPVAMLAHEVQRILQLEKGDTEEAPKLKIPYEIGDMVKITDGTFKEIEGEVTTIDEITGRVTVIITIFARSTPVELEYWQIEKAG